MLFVEGRYACLLLVFRTKLWSGCRCFLGDGCACILLVFLGKAVLVTWCFQKVDESVFSLFLVGLTTGLHAFALLHPVRFTPDRTLNT